MEKLETNLREIVKNLFSQQKIEVFIGYQKGTIPLRTAPTFISKVDEVDKLVWNYCCDFDLTRYFLEEENKGKKVGILVKGCDARALVVCLNEGQIERESIVIVGMPCQGIINRKKIIAEVAPKEILEATVTAEQITVKGKDFEQTFPTKEYLQGCCSGCAYNIPPSYDILVDEKPVEVLNKIDWDAILDEFEAKSPEERWDYFTNLLKDCIRCYACRNACPVCYCPECFVDQTQPQWVGKTNDLADIIFYHMVRALHVAGRCVECGACTRVCPMNIDVRLLIKKVERIIKDRYNFESGLDVSAPPPMGTHSPEDPEEFITEPH
ncbi:MAG: 4Fe-4S dicluster domain-containing protein [Candidatus Helarchaeota archaeon]